MVVTPCTPRAREMTPSTPRAREREPAASPSTSGKRLLLPSRSGRGRDLEESEPTPRTGRLPSARSGARLVHLTPLQLEGDRAASSKSLHGSSGKSRKGDFKEVKEVKEAKEAKGLKEAKEAKEVIEVKPIRPVPLSGGPEEEGDYELDFEDADTSSARYEDDFEALVETVEGVDVTPRAKGSPVPGPNRGRLSSNFSDAPPGYCSRDVDDVDAADSPYPEESKQDIEVRKWCNDLLLMIIC